MEAEAGTPESPSRKGAPQKGENMTYNKLELPKAGDRVVVGMSGGVDSTMTALLLKEKGCLVTGVTMSLWDGDSLSLSRAALMNTSCYSPLEKNNMDECADFCAGHDIPYFTVDVKEAYKKEVIEYFKNEYRNARTPNPCVRCNQFVKFGALLEGVKNLGVEFDYFCTGHYASLVRGDECVASAFGKTDSFGAGGSRPVQIAFASDAAKDQSYFLSRLSSAVLEKVRFPLSSFTKKEVVQMAKDFNLVAASRKESQDFIQGEMLESLFSDKPSVPGNIIDSDGKILGKHRGIEHYTIGQRRGLGVSSSKPLYVESIDKERNVVVLGHADDLFSSALIADDFVWPADYDPDCAFEAFVKIRLASKPVKALVRPYFAKDGEHFTGKPYLVEFEQAQRAVSPGQTVVFYKDGVTCAAGIIVRAVK